MKKLTLFSIVLVLFFLIGCNINENIAPVVEKSYVVVTKGIDAVDQISQKVTGCELGEDIQGELESVRNALVALKGTLVSIGDFVGADLPVVSVLEEENPIIALDIATEDLIRSTERIE